MSDRPFLCRLGIHTSVCYDSAMFNAADRCNKCGRWLDQVAGAKVVRERYLWGKYDNPGEVMNAWMRGEKS